MHLPTVTDWLSCFFPVGQMALREIQKQSSIRLSARPSVRLSVALRYRGHIGGLEYFENNFIAD